MERQPKHQAFSKLAISFPNGHQALAVLPYAGTHVIDFLSDLHIPAPNAVIMIVGGAFSMDGEISPNMLNLFSDGIAHLAASLSALIIDGGTCAGVMEMMGKGVAEQQHRSTLLGVSPVGCVTFPDKPTTLVSEENVPLDPNHSHFVLVDSDEWGGETATMYELAQVFSKDRPSVAIVVNGGSIARKEVLYNVRQGRPIIVITGSGRVADDIAGLWQEKPSSIPDPELAEIIQHGNIHLFPLTGPTTELVQLSRSLLGNQ